jgi:protein-disulfide isomerase
MPQKEQKLTKKQNGKLGKQKKLGQKQLTEQRTAKKKKSIRSAIIWLGVVFGLILVVLGMIKITSSSKSEVTRLTDQNSVVNWVQGNKSAKINLVEYSDFQCSACAFYYRITKRLIEELKDDFQLTFRHYPLKKHVNSKLAAKSAEAAGRQGKFWEMHDLLFERQKEWAKKKNEDAERLFMQYAAFLNLNVERFQVDLNSQTVANKVHNDYQSGRHSGVKGTPTFFLNGKKIIDKPRSYATFKDLILKSKPNLS